MYVSVIHSPKVWDAGKDYVGNSRLWALLFLKHSHIVLLISNVTSHSSNM